MSLPAGVTRIPRRSVTYTTLSSFMLANRTGNDATGDLANVGNVLISSNAQQRKKAATLESLLDNGDHMAVVVGNDIRSFISADSNRTVASNVKDRLRTLLPNVIYYANPTGATRTLEFDGYGMCRPGDRVTFVNCSGTQDFCVRLKGSNYSEPYFFDYANGMTNQEISTIPKGGSVTIEYGYRDSSNLVWYVVEINGRGTIYLG